MKKLVVLGVFGLAFAKAAPAIFLLLLIAAQGESLGLTIFGYFVGFFPTSGGISNFILGL